MTRTIADTHRVTRTAVERPAPAADLLDRPPAQEWLYRWIKPLASLRLTVALLGLSIFLVFAGTLAQIDQGIWQVMDQYFRTRYGIAWIDLYIFFPRSWDVPDIRFPYPGGYLLGGLLLLNLLSAHAVRFTMKTRGRRLVVGSVVTGIGALLTALLIAEVHFAVPTLHDFYVELLLITIVVAILGVGFWQLFHKRCGIVMLHAGLIILLVSEAITGWFAVEGQMRILIGDSSNFLRDIRSVELFVLDPEGASDSEKDLVTAVPHNAIRAGRTLRRDLLPFDIEIKSYLPNSGLVQASTAPVADRKGPFVRLPEPRIGPIDYAVVARDPVSGTSSSGAVDMPAVDVVLKDRQSGETLLDGRLSLMHTEFLQQQLDLPQQLVAVTVGDKEYYVGLRFERIYKPYTIHLKDFKHEVYLGTTRPKDFSSFVRLVDPTRNEDREVRIWMNHPLRYAGETFFQASWIPEGGMEGGRAIGTVLQVVENPGRIVPYLSCIMVAGGLIAHFLVGLSRFTQRRLGT